MTYVPRLITAPTDYPVSLSEAKAHCRISHDDEDATVTALIMAATAHLDGYVGVLGRCLVTQRWAVEVDSLDLVCPPLIPVIDLVDVTYKSTDGLDVSLPVLKKRIGDTASGTAFQLTADTPVDRDTDYPYIVTFDVGYGDAGAVPTPLKHAILMLVAHWYEAREAAVIGAAAVSVPFAVSALIAPYKAV